MSAELKLDHQGLAELLKSAQFQAAVHERAVEIAAAAKSSHPDAEEVVVDDYTTDRAASSVTIKDVRAAGWQARDGVLTKAAAHTGLEVRSR